MRSSPSHILNMASSSHYNFEGSIYENFDRHFDQHFDQTFENFFLSLWWSRRGEVGKEKNEFTSKEIVNQAIYVYGMIISVKLQRILKIYSDDVLE